MRPSKSSLFRSLNRYFRQFSNLARIKISPTAQIKFERLLESKSEDPYKDYLKIQEEATDLLKKLIPEAEEVLGNFGKKGCSILLIDNCPISGSAGLPPIPSSSTKPKNKDYVSEYFMLGLAGLVGAKPLVTANTRDGSVINQVIPLNPESISGSGSKKEFPMHNEVIHEAIVPDYFILLCLTGNPLAKTRYCFLEEIIHYLPPQVIEELQKPNFLMKSGDASLFKEPKQLIAPILTKDQNGEFNIRLNLAPGRCEALTPEAAIALDYLKYCIKNNTPVYDIGLDDGQAVIIHDRRMLHSRGAFEGERWLQRMNLQKESAEKLTR